MYVDNGQNEESERINIRTRHWEYIVNECTKLWVRKMDPLNVNVTKIKVFVYKPSENEMNRFLSYLFVWNGLDTKLIANKLKPKTIKDYQQKAKNWANGARAREYAKYLYPNMIQYAQKYAIITSKELFKNTKSVKCQKLFCEILMYSYLVQLCSKQILLISGKRKVHLLCNNSLKSRKSNVTRKIFQSYANDHNYNIQFPAHRKEAIDYFTLKTKVLFKSLMVILQKEPKTEKHLNNNDNNNNIEEMISNVMNYININCKTNDGNGVIINIDNWNIIQSAINEIEVNNTKNKQRINELKRIITKLESFNTFYVQAPKIRFMSYQKTEPISIIKMECDTYRQQTVRIHIISYLYTFILLIIYKFINSYHLNQIQI